tara:strand:+ start:22066 stop:22257 length:192 start_codon:yes stop_codon:yes gene_type:complete
MSNQNSKSSIEKHTNLAELGHLKAAHFDIYKELMKQFKCDVRACNERLTKPKRPFKVSHRLNS